MQRRPEHLELIRQVAEGRPHDLLFFWSHKESPNHRPSRACLSQWYSASFIVEGVRYPTAEHFMMAEKARTFGDEEAAQRILNDDDPAAARAIGREVRSFDQRRWVAERFEVVSRGTVAKFTGHEDLREYLLGTQPSVLVEASPNDRVWGIGANEDDPRAAHPSAWPGLNLLGFALMKARDSLAADPLAGGSTT